MSLVVLAACSSAPKPVKTVKADTDPQGPHKDAIAAQIKPLVDRGVVSGIVVGLYDAGKTEIYGFGKGPHGAAPNGHTLFEIGSITKVYTSLLFADAIQRKEVALDTPVSELLPPGITMPASGAQPITLAHLALHVSGLPRLPPLVAQHAKDPDPYGKYDENALYQDLIHTPLEHAPGEQVVYSNFGVGLLGFVLGRKIGPGYSKALETRILQPLELHDTFVTVPPAAAARRITGTDDDLKPVSPWTFDALAGAGALVSDARDQLTLIDAELDASAGSKLGLRGAMKLTQEPQLANAVGDNEGLGWQIDNTGRYWHNGGTGGFHAFISFDPKTRRGVVVLASTSVSLVDHLGDDLYKILAGQPVKAPSFPNADQLKPLVGTYDLSGDKLNVVATGDRLYIEGGGIKLRLVPANDHEFWVEALQAIAAFETKAGKVSRIVFVVGQNSMSAARID